MTEANGIPAGMAKAANRTLDPNLDDPHLKRHPTGQCPQDRLDECGPLAVADQGSTDHLQKFLTHVNEGFHGLRWVLAGCARLYENGRQASTGELDSVIAKAGDPAAPDLATVFQTPPSAPAS